MEQLELPIGISRNKEVVVFSHRPFKGSLIKVYLISEAEAKRRSKGKIENRKDDYCFCRCVGVEVCNQRKTPREVALVKRLDSDFSTNEVDYFLEKQKVRFLR
jgi:hypothetical protein